MYWNVLDNERKGVYNGETVQVIPHITNEIKKFIYSVGKKINADVVITEIGGTTGDIESLPFLEAIRQVSNEAGRENCLFIHVTLAPVISSSGEMKTKPTQHSVKELQSLGITPNLVVLRCSRPIDEAARKITLSIKACSPDENAGEEKATGEAKEPRADKKPKRAKSAKPETEDGGSQWNEDIVNNPFADLLKDLGEDNN